MTRKVLILAPYPLGEAPSQRFRFEHFLPFFGDQHLSYRFQSFWTVRGWNCLYQKGHVEKKVYYFFLGFLRRATLLLTAFPYKFILIHRELTPVGPPMFEFILTRLFKKKIIYDFDDAIWLPNTSEANKFIVRLKYHRKVKSICRWSWKVSVGNAYLAAFALSHNANVSIIPTVVDTVSHHNRLKVHRTDLKPVVGWTGTHSTSVYLKMLENPLKKLQQKVDFSFLVISNQPPRIDLDNVVYLPWDKEKEIEQLLQMDIGVMPLENYEWELGKCGFKLIQYLSLGIPAVASPVGVNSEIIDHSVNGFLVPTEEEWVDYLARLMESKDLRERLGTMGRKKIEDQFSVAASRDLFFSMFA